MKRKTLNNLLKGMAGTGAVLGGATLISQTDVVYAAEDNLRTEEETEETKEILGQEGSETAVVELTQTGESEAVGLEEAPLAESVKVQALDDQGEGSADGAESGQTKTVEASEEKDQDQSDALGDQTDLTDQKDQAEDQGTAAEEKLSEAQEKLEKKTDELEDKYDSLNDVKEKLASQSADAEAKASSVSQSLYESHSNATSLYRSMSEKLSQAVSEYDSNYDDFKASGGYDENLESLFKQINEKQAEVDAEKQAAINSGKRLAATQYFYRANELANLLTKYRFYQEKQVSEITYSEWKHDGENKGYGNNYVYVAYERTAEQAEPSILDGYNNEAIEYEAKGGAAGKGEAYFDYVNSNDKHAATDGQEDENGKYVWENQKLKPEEVDYITVVYKTPIYEGDKGSKLTREIDPSGKEIFTLTRDGEKTKIHSIVKQKDGTYWVSYKYTAAINRVDGRTSYVQLDYGEKFTFTKTFTDKGKLYFSIGDFKDRVDEYNDKRSTVTEKESEVSSSSTETSEFEDRNESNSIKTSLDMSESVKSSESISESVSIEQSVLDSESAVLDSQSNSLDEDSRSMSTSASAESQSNSLDEDSRSMSTSASAESQSNSMDEDSRSMSTSASAESQSNGPDESESNGNGGNPVNTDGDNPNGGGTPAGDTNPTAPTDTTVPTAPTETTEITDEETPLADPTEVVEPTETADDTTEIADEEVPLSEIADEEVPLADIEDEEVPLAVIEDDETPLSDNPQTGDALTMSLAGTAAVSAAGLAAASRKKKKDEARD